MSSCEMSSEAASHLNRCGVAMLSLGSFKRTDDDEQRGWGEADHEPQATIVGSVSHRLCFRD